MFSKGQCIELSISDMAEGRNGFGKLPDGLGVLVEGPVAVGDRVAANISAIRQNYLEARLAAVLEPSPHRVAPPCAHFGVCGGCKWQHVDYAEQLRLKQKMVADALRHIGGFGDVEVAPTQPSARTYGYRNKIELSFGDRRYLLEDELRREESPLAKPRDYALGFHAAGRFEKVVDIDRCHLATDEMNRVLDFTKRFFGERRVSVYSSYSHEGFLRNLVLRHARHTGEFMVYLITSSHDRPMMEEYLAALRALLGERLTTLVNGVTARKNNVARGDSHIVLHGTGTITERLGDLRFVISPESFFQTNTEQAEWLCGTALDMAEISRDSVVYDLYCGTGAIALAAARRCRAVVGFELEPQAVADAKFNARLNAVSNCDFVQVDMKHIERALAGRETSDVVITDPPRAGMHANAVAVLCGMRPRTIVYVSCNPASLARDARRLSEQGGYRLAAVQPVDMFPHTYHVESIVRLEREGHE